MTDLRLSIDPELIPSGKDILHYFHRQIVQIGLKINPRSKKKDSEEIFKLLNQHIYYPDSQQADLHRSANRLGELDLKKKKERQMANLKNSVIVRVDNKICNCCGFFVQQQGLSNCQNQLMEIRSLGSSTVVFFQTFINIAVLLLIMAVVYSVFSFATNLSVARDTNKGALDYLAISLGAKANASSTNNDSNTFYLASSWLGVGMLFIWLIALIKMKKDIKILQSEAKSYTSVSDFSVVIQQMPIGLSKQRVQMMMNEYLARIAPADIKFTQLKVEKYNEAKPFYFNQDQFNDRELQEAYNRLKEIKTEMIGWISERIQEEDFSSTQQYREVKIAQLVSLKQKIQRKKQEICKKIVSKLKQQNEQTNTFVFITFETIQQRDFFLAHNDNSILSKIKSIFPCVDKSNRFTIPTDNNTQARYLTIQSAPEPEDINWGNIGFDKCETAWRKLATVFATLVILGISFVIAYALSRVQNEKSNERFLSFFISLVISVINLIIIKVIQYMTVFEKLYTNNTFQISLAYKSVFAQLLNSIFIPIAVNIYIKDDNVYGESGLTQDIFILALTNSFIPPLVRLIDPYYIYVFLKYQYYKRPLYKLGMTQYQLNFLAEKPEFQLGIEYIYLISNFLFTCYFVSLQPIIPYFALLGLFFMYWIQKYALFSKSQRPIPGIDTINVVMHQLIYLGGIAYALGSLTWANFLNDSKFRNSLVANLVAAGLGFLIFIFPYEAFASYTQSKHLKKTYADRRIYFPAEYDRLNPVTKVEGVREYREFLLKKKQQIQKLQVQQQEEIAAKLLQLTQHNTHKQHGKRLIGGRSEVKDVVNQLFLNQTRNIVDPKTLKFFLLPELGRDRNLDLYVSTLQMVNRKESFVQFAHKSHQNIQDMRQQQAASHNNDYSIIEKNKQDNLKNMYKSTLRLADLGLFSNQELNRSHHR